MTCQDRVWVSGINVNVSDLEPSYHEEADIRIILHSVHVGRNSFSKIAVTTVDTDIVVLAVSFFLRCR